AKGQIGLHFKKTVGTVEAFRSHTDDCNGAAVDGNFAADNARIRGEMRFPICIAEDEDGIGIGGAAFGGEDQAAESRLQAEGFEKIAADVTRKQAFALAVDADA